MRKVIGAALVAVVVSAMLPVAARAEGGTGDAVVQAFGLAPFRGSTGDAPLASPLVGMAATPSGQGYWLVASDGGVFTYGDAGFYGSTGAITLNEPIVGMAATPSGQGYWLVASDGGVFSFGDAGFRGSTGDIVLNRPVVGMAATPSGGGYWLAASDGGVFAFGDAGFYGSTGDIVLNRPVVGMARTPTGRGYWMVASDGGVFTFGDGGFYGSPVGAIGAGTVSAIAATPSGRGYWVAARDGRVLPFGDAPGLGSFTGQLPTGRVVVGMASHPLGLGYWLVSSSIVLTLGLVDPSVTAVQERLLDLGYWVQVTGTFDFVTQQAVWALQKVAGLPRTGRVAEAELAALAQGVRPEPRSTSGYVIEVDKSRQVIIVARDGRAELIFNTSTGTGRRYCDGGSCGIAVTPEGEFSIQRQIDGTRISALGVLYRPKYFTGGYAVHGSPSIPPFPASHGCVRVSNAAINYIWANDVMPLGTPLWSYS